MRTNRGGTVGLLWILLIAAAPAPMVAPTPLTSGSVPMSYAALTDRRVRPEPPLPAMGPRGSVVIDPTFGTRILRVTDGALVSEQPNRAWFSSDGSAEALQWNADATRFLVNGAGGETLVFDFDRVAFTTTRRAMPRGVWYLPVSGPVWDPTNPAFAYGAEGSGVSRYDVVTQTLTLVWDTSALGAAPRSMSIGNNRRLAGYVGAQDSATKAVAKDLTTGQTWMLDTRAGTINGTAVPGFTPFTIHNVRMGQEGRYAVLSVSSGGAGGLAIWDLDAATVGWCTLRCGGHKVGAYGVLLNNDNLPGGTYLGYQVLKRPMTAPGAAMALLREPPSPVNGTDSHYSWGNARPGLAVPVIASSTGEGLGTRPVVAAWDREIIAIATDGSGTVWRLAHHRSLFQNFWDGPHATVSRDGQYVLFGSNWGRSLGPDAAGGARQDVFVVELR
jgi:hypothetical protein